MAPTDGTSLDLNCLNYMLAIVCSCSPPAGTAILEAVQVQSDQQISYFIVLRSMRSQT